MECAADSPAFLERVEQWSVLVSRSQLREPHAAVSHVAWALVQGMEQWSVLLISQAFRRAWNNGVCW